MPHENTCSILIFLLARPRGIEPLTKNLEGTFNALPTQLYKIYIFLRQLHTGNKIYYALIRGAELEQKNFFCFIIISGRRRGWGLTPRLPCQLQPKRLLHIGNSPTYKWYTQWGKVTQTNEND